MLSNKINEQGYSLVELMTIIAIIGIIGSIALVSYREYAIRASIASVSSVAGVPKNAVEAAHNEGTIFGTSGDEVFISSGASSKPFGLDSMTRVDYGCVDIDLSLADLELDPTNTLIITWCPTIDSGAIEWTCGYDSSSTASYVTYLPNECQVVHTSIQDTSF